MKVIPVLLLLLLTLPSRGQSLDSLPLLKKVYASFEGKFKPFLGQQKKEHLPTIVYTSQVQIEGTLENEIVQFSGDNAAYFGSLGKELTIQDARTVVERWRNVLIKLLSKDYKQESEKMTHTLGKDYLGYKFIKVIGYTYYTLDVYFMKTSKKGIYEAGLMFTNSIGEDTK